jgi:hypothetical protein
VCYGALCGVCGAGVPAGVLSERVVGGWTQVAASMDEAEQEEAEKKRPKVPVKKRGKK